MIGWARPVSFVNARVAAEGGTASTVRFAAAVLSIDDQPRKGDVVVDLDGAHVIPGLVNAHDHLELNHYGTLKRRACYRNAREWIDDLEPLLKDDPAVRRNMAYPLEWRLFIGGLKNILAGVTTVAHHNPRYKEIHRSFPVRVLEKYGWAHSFYLEGRPVGAKGERGGSVRGEFAATPPERPFFVHVAEGLDGHAEAELDALEAAGGLRENTVLVHGVAIPPDGWRRVVAARASLVWCPASNVFLLGRTISPRRLFEAHEMPLDRIALATDSRLTGANDLLDEIRVARQTGATADELFRMVTTSAGNVLKLPDAGRLRVGAPADLLVLPANSGSASEALVASKRRDVHLVVRQGKPVVGDPRLRAVFAARRAASRPIIVDGRERIAESRLASRIARSPIREPGVACL